MPVFPPRPLLFVLTSHVLTFWPAGLVGRTARWLYLFVWTADGLACWLVVEISGLPVPHVVRLFIYPSVHDACLSFCLFFGLCHLCFSSTACQESSLCRHKKSTFSPSPFTLPNLSSLCLRFCCCSFWLSGDSANLLVLGALRVLIVSPVALQEMGETPICSVWVCRFMYVYVSACICSSVYVCRPMWYTVCDNTRGLWGSVSPVGSVKCVVYPSSGGNDTWLGWISLIGVDVSLLLCLTTDFYSVTQNVNFKDLIRGLGYWDSKMFLYLNALLLKLVIGSNLMSGVFWF